MKSVDVCSLQIYKHVGKSELFTAFNIMSPYFVLEMIASIPPPPATWIINTT